MTPVRLSVGYSEPRELEVLNAVFGQLEGDYRVELVELPEDKVKFELERLDLAYVPSTYTFLTKSVKVLTSLAFVGSQFKVIYLDERSRTVGVEKTWSLEYYLAKALKFNVKIGGFNGETLDLLPYWEQRCPNVPIVRKVLASLKLADEDLRRLKANIRKALTQVQLPHGFVKELGRNGAAFVSCMRRIMADANSPLISEPELY